MPNPAAAYDAIIASVLSAAPAALGSVEAALVQVVAGAAPVAAAAAPEFPFPRDAAILAELTNAPANWPVVIKHHIDDFVLPQFQAIPATPLAGAPGGAKVAWNTTAQLDKIVRKESDVAAVLPPTNSFPNADLSRLDFKLHQLQESPGHDIANGWRLVKDYSSAAPEKVPPSAYSSRAVAKQAIKNLAAFEGFCIRLAGAIIASDRAGVSLAETLALWRTEGDLLVPYSEGRRAAGAPTCDVIKEISLGDDTEEVFFSMKRGLWTLTYSIRGGGALPTDAAAKTRIDNAFKLNAFIDWSLVAAGVDFFWRQIPVNYGDRAVSVTAIAQFLNALHVGGGLPDDTPARRAECEAVLNELDCILPANPNQRAIVSPRNPVKLISLMVGEAMIFAGLDTVAGKGPVVPPTPKLKYLAYHCQDHRDAADVAQDKFTLMLVSAAVAAAHGPAGALKTSLAPSLAHPDFPKSSDLKEPNFDLPAVTGDTSGHLKGYQVLADGGWWNPANIDNLADFMLVATPLQWRGWPELRGNMARYAKLRAYYDKLLS